MLFGDRCHLLHKELGKHRTVSTIFPLLCALKLSSNAAFSDAPALIVTSKHVDFFRKFRKFGLSDTSTCCQHKLCNSNSFTTHQTNSILQYKYHTYTCPQSLLGTIVRQQYIICRNFSSRGEQGLVVVITYKINDQFSMNISYMIVV